MMSIVTQGYGAEQRIVTQGYRATVLDVRGTVVSTAVPLGGIVSRATLAGGVTSAVVVLADAASEAV